MTLKETLQEAESKKVAVGHFNIADLAALKAIVNASRDLKAPVIIGTSEGERDFVGIHQAVSLVRSLREEGYRVFLNADHTRSVEKAKEAVDAGYDAVLFDGGNLPIEENIKETKKVVEYARRVSESEKREIIIEGELGYIGTSSKLLDEIPEGAAIEEKDLTRTEEAERFVKETGVDLLAPAVGNIHGMFRDSHNPSLSIDRVRAIRGAAGVPLVLHGGSGISNVDFSAAIEAGVVIVHINTEIRKAWREGLERGLKDNPDEIAPYKILPAAIASVEILVKKHLKLFNNIS